MAPERECDGGAERQQQGQAGGVEGGAAHVDPGPAAESGGDAHASSVDADGASAQATVAFNATARAAGVDRRGPTGANRTFHSLRHTYAKRSLEVGAQITRHSRHLGHTSVQVTTGVHGHWERAERRRQAQQPAGAFGI